jgi:hypothetical protein
MIMAAGAKKDRRNAGQQWFKSTSVTLRCLLGGAPRLDDHGCTRKENKVKASEQWLNSTLVLSATSCVVPQVWIIMAAHGKINEEPQSQQWLNSISVALRCLLGGAPSLDNHGCTWQRNGINCK